MIDLTAFRNWQLDGKRSVVIEMGSAADRETFTVWVYDYDLGVGQFVHSVDEIDLDKVLRERYEQTLKDYARLVER